MLVQDSRQPGPPGVPGPPSLPLLTWMTFAISVAILGCVLYVVWWSMSTESELCKQAAQSALRRNASDAAMIHYMTSINVAMMKTRALCFAFVLIFLGSVYVLSPIRTKFSFGLEHESVRGRLVAESSGSLNKDGSSHRLDPHPASTARGRNRENRAASLPIHRMLPSRRRISRRGRTGPIRRPPRCRSAVAGPTG